MKLQRAIVSSAAAAMLLGATLFSPAFAAAPNPSGFSALEGVEDVYALSADEMKAITGELNALDIASELGAQALSATNPKVAQALADSSLFFTRNAPQINALFSKLGILTPCKVCVPQ